MLPSEVALPPAWVKAELRRLQQGQGLAHPASVMQLDPRLRNLITGDPEGLTSADEVLRLVSALRRSINRLGSHERLLALVDFNLSSEHSYPTLTGRQESLARERRCAAKTIRRHADQALDTLALIVARGEQARTIWPDAGPLPADAGGQHWSAPGTGWRR